MTAAPKLNQVLGVDAEESELEYVERIRDGLPYDVVEQLRESLALSLGGFADAVGVSKRTLNRRRRYGVLKPDESDRVYRLARVYAHAFDVLEEHDDVVEWFKSENRALGGRIPLEMFDTDAGAEIVDDVLTRIEYGVYT